MGFCTALPTFEYVLRFNNVVVGTVGDHIKFKIEGKISLLISTNFDSHRQLHLSTRPIVDVASRYTALSGFVVP